MLRGSEYRKLSLCMLLDGSWCAEYSQADGAFIRTADVDPIEAMRKLWSACHDRKAARPLIEAMMDAKAKAFLYEMDFSEHRPV